MMKIKIALLGIIFGFSLFGHGAQGNLDLFGLIESGDIQKFEKSLSLSLNSKDQKNSAGETLLIVAVSRGKVDFVKALIKSKVKLDEVDGARNSALLYSVSQGDLEMTKLLVKAGASIQKVQGENEEPLLFEACRIGNLSLVELILKNDKVSLNAKSKSGKTALAVALESSQGELAMALIKKGAKVNKLEKFDGKTLAELAQEMGLGKNTELMSRLR